MLRPQHTTTAAQREIATKSTYSYTKLVGRNRYPIAAQLEILQLPTNTDAVNARAFSKGRK